MKPNETPRDRWRSRGVCDGLAVPLGELKGRRGLVDQAVAYADAHRVRAIVGVKLHPKAVDTRLDRLLRHEKPLGDLLVQEPVRDELEYLGLTLRQLQLEAGRSG